MSLPHLLETSEPRLTGSVCFTHMSEAAFHKFTATLLKVLALRACHALPFAMKRGFRLLVFIGPSSFPTLMFRDIVAKAQFRAGLEHSVGVNLCPPQLAESPHRPNRKSEPAPTCDYRTEARRCSSALRSRGYKTSRISPVTKPVTTSSKARKYQSVPFPPTRESSSPASFSTLTFAFKETAGAPTPARRLLIRVA